MNKITKTIFAISIFIFIAIFGFRSQDSKTIKIGAILPLSGSQASFGENMQNSLNLAFKNRPNTKYKYELIFEDGAFDQKTSINAAYKLINTNHVTAIIDAYAPIGNAISPITEKNKIVHINIAFDPKIAEGDYNFLLFSKPANAAESFLKEMKNRGLKTLSIFAVNNQGIASVDRAFHDLALQYDIEILSDETFQPGERDFHSIIAKNTKEKADIYVLLALSPEIEILAKQLKEIGIGNISTTVYFELAKDKGVFEGLWSIGLAESNKKFSNQFEETFKRDISFGVPNVYDAYNIIVDSAESYSEKNIPTNEYIMNKIKNMDKYNGVLGELSIDEKGIIDTPLIKKIIRGGKLMPL